MSISARFFRYGISLLAVLLLILAGLIGLAGSNWGLQQAARALEHYSGEKVTAKGASGSLYGPLHVDQFDIQTSTQHIHLGGLDLDWTPKALLQRKLVITQLDANELAITQIKPSAEPLTLPASLQLPLKVSIEPVKLAQLRIEKGPARFLMSHIEASLKKPGDVYQLSLKRLDSLWGSITGSLELTDRLPYVLNAAISASQGARYHLQAQAHGTLSDFQVNVHALDPFALDLQSRLTPFKSIPIQFANLTASGIDPARLHAGLPRADIGVQGHFTMTGEQRLHGEVYLQNVLSGPVDQNQLPVKSLQGQLDGLLDDLAFNSLHVDLGAGGQLDGRGSLRRGRLALTADTRNLNPHAIHSRVRPMKLAGRIEVEATGTEQSLKTSLSYQRYQLAADLSRHGDALQIKTARLAAGTGQLAVKGVVALSAHGAFDLQGLLNHFNPAALGNYPAANLNAQIKAAGTLSPVAGNLRFDMAKSRFRNQPVTGNGRLYLTPSRISNSEVSLAIGGNRLFLQGSFGAPGDQLRWNLNGANLAVLDPKLSGQLDAAGTLQGSIAEPAGSLEINASALRWANTYELSHLHAKGRLAQGLDGTAELRADLQGLGHGTFKLKQATLAIHGRRRDHQIDISLLNDKLDLTARLSGSLGETWSGEIRQLENRGAYPFNLQAPAKLVVGRQQQEFGPAVVNFMGGHLRLTSFARRNHQIVSRGQLDSMPVITLLHLSGASQAFDGNLQIAGDWNIRMDDHPEVHIGLHRQQGDVIALTEPKLALGISGLRLDLSLKDERIKGELTATGSQLGSLHLAGDSELTRRDGKWGLAGNSPLSGRGEFDLPSLTWLSPLLDPAGGLKLVGAAHARASLSGTIAHPSTSGQLTGDQIGVNWPEIGLHLSSGKLDAALEDESLVLRHFEINGGKGRFTAQGVSRLKNQEPWVNVSGTAEQLEILSRPDLKLVISGKAQAVLEDRHFVVNGDIKADRALIELPKANRVARSDDVIIVGRTAAPSASPSTRFKIDMELDLGKNFALKGRGLDAQLTGKLKVVADTPAHPKVYGSVNVTKGTYSAYGQNLVIDRGILDFHGPLDNPGLDIVAMRKNQPVEAGVSVSGTALVPKAKLVSNPDVAESEKLSWLVLGRSMESASGNDYDLLTAAAGALLSADQSVSLQSRIAHAAGLDEVGLKSSTTGTGGLETTVLSLGKRLSDKAYLSYEQGMSSVTTVLKLNYSLTRRLSVEAKTGQENTVDLLYTFSFN
ncbi:MAG: translocation/assembly module TamB domain-containing protein [Thiobacillaceae bacterium]